MKKRALVTGISGQDGYYLAHLLHSKDYEVFGLSHGKHPDDSALHDSIPFVQLLSGDLTDSRSLMEACEAAAPDEVYNLGAQSAVDLSFKKPEATLDVNGVGVFRMLEAVRQVRPTARFYQASSSEMFGDSKIVPQNEGTPFAPRSPYAAAKVLGHHTVGWFRAAYGIFACSGICFNHESPRRGYGFVSRKVTSGVARILSGLQLEIRLGNIEAQRDWGFAGDYVVAMWMMLQQEQPGDYVVATGTAHSIRELLELTFELAGISCWEDYVVHSAVENMRPADVRRLVGDPTRARERLGWVPRTGFRDLIKMMLEADIAAASGVPAVAKMDDRAALSRKDDSTCDEFTLRDRLVP
jgi:GDPmannose 4,6-dehydratase